MKKLLTSKHYIVTVNTAGILFAVLMLLGGFSYYDSINLLSKDAGDIISNGLFFLKNLFIFIIVTVIISVALFFLEKNKIKTIKISNRYFFIIPFVTLIIFYGFIYAVFFPGIAGYDVYMQIPQALGYEELTAHHPVMHTLFIRLCFLIGNLFPYKSSGLIVYSILQIVIYSAGISYSIYLVCKNKLSLLPLLIVVVCFVVYPTFALFAFNLTKDSIFSVIFLCFALKLYYLKNKLESTRIDYVITAGLGLMACLFRNNAVYALLVLMIILAFTKFNRKALLSLLFCIIGYLIISNVIFGRILHIDSPQQEKLSIPIQQITAVSVLSPDDVDEETEKIIEEYLPLHKNRFIRTSVDLVKVSFNNDKYNQDKISFWKVWFKLGIEHPIAYIKYGILLNLESWYPYYEFKDPNFYTQYINTELQLKYIDSKFDDDRIYLFPEVYNSLEEYSNYDARIMNTKGLGLIFSLSLPFLYLYQMVVQSIAMKKYKCLLIFLPFLLLWATHLLGPLSNLRYFLTILMLFPLGICVFTKEKSCKFIDLFSIHSKKEHN